MANERLRSAMTARGLTVTDVATHVQVDPKTVQRWLGGRTPHSRHRWATAVLLQEGESYLWPSAPAGRDSGETSMTELVAFYAHRSDVPTGLWRTLLEHAQHQIDVLVYAAVFLPEQLLDLIDLLRSKAAAGCHIRIALGDLRSAKVIERGQEEKFGTGIVSRAELALLHYEPLRDCAGIQVHVHGTTLYNSIYRFDEVMLVNTHVWGMNAYGAPVLHLRQRSPGGVFDTYARSFEAVWAESRPAYPAAASGA